MILVHLDNETNAPFKILNALAECPLDQPIRVVAVAVTDKNFELLLNNAYQLGLAQRVQPTTE